MKLNVTLALCLLQLAVVTTSMAASMPNQLPYRIDENKQDQLTNHLSLDAAIKIAIERDPKLLAIQKQADAFREAAVAANALPDPKIKLGLMNVPTDTWAFNQEPMTQKQIGIQQMFPAGDTLEYKSRRELSMASMEDASAANQLAILKRDMRQAWLDLYYWQYAEKITRETRSLLAKFMSVTESNYAAGRQQQQDVIRAELELELIQDKLDDIAAQQAVIKAKLVKMVGQEMATDMIAQTLPSLPELVNFNQHRTQLESHPMLQMQQARVDASQHGVSIAEQSYKPNWMLDVTYGFRETAQNGVDRPDFASVMVLFDLPLFGGNLQDRKVSASKFRRLAASEDLELKRRELAREYESKYAEWQQVSARVARYHKTLIPKARENSEAALSAYQSDRGKFTMLMRAMMTKLDIELKAQRLAVKQRKLQSALLYLLGENQ